MFSFSSKRSTELYRYADEKGKNKTTSRVTRWVFWRSTPPFIRLFCSFFSFSRFFSPTDVYRKQGGGVLVFFYTYPLRISSSQSVIHSYLIIRKTSIVKLVAFLFPLHRRRRCRCTSTYTSIFSCSIITANDKQYQFKQHRSCLSSSTDANRFFK